MPRRRGASLGHSVGATVPRACALLSFVVGVLYLESVFFLSPANNDRALRNKHSHTASFWPMQTSEEPDLVGLVTRLSLAMAPFQHSYRSHVAAANGPAPKENCKDGLYAHHANTHLNGCPSAGCFKLPTLHDAKKLCSKLKDCGGITESFPGQFDLQSSSTPEKSSVGETSWVTSNTCIRNVHELVPAILNSYRNAMVAALEDPSLNLNTPLPKTRGDGSIYISVSSYRDNTCGATIRRALERADHPELLTIGVVQQNCNFACKMFKMQGDKKKEYPQLHPDPDCLAGLCESELGRKHCEAGRIRILRLQESEAFGPLFSRFLNAKMWRGENYYLQIDAHTEFRTGWDSTLKQQIERTPSYPNSVLSNYPPGGSPLHSTEWPRAVPSKTGPPPKALCGVKITPSGTVVSMEMRRSDRKLSSQTDLFTPRHSAFVAAGFYFAHGSIVQKVPFDPFAPFVFSGEEMSLSIRFWTSGFDLYAPSVDVVKHSYYRLNHPKFWETVDMVFSKRGAFYYLKEAVLPRILHMIGLPDGKKRVKPDLTRLENYQVGRVRTRAEFAKAVGLDMISQKQTVPTWCVTGELPPFAK